MPRQSCVHLTVRPDADTMTPCLTFVHLLNKLECKLLAHAWGPSPCKHLMLAAFVLHNSNIQEQLEKAGCQQPFAVLKMGHWQFIPARMSYMHR